MNINALPIFVAVIQQGSFSKAADYLGITKSAVSKRITALEENLGVKLITRSTRKLSLTEAGEKYFQHALTALTAVNDAEDAATAHQNKPSGILTVNTPMSFGRLHIAPLMATFLKQYPDIQLRMDMSDVWSDVIGEGYDVAIRAADLKDSSLIARKIAPLKSVLCASPEYVKNHGAPQTPHDLLNHNCVIYSYSDGAGDWHFYKDDEPLTIRVNGNYNINNSEALAIALQDGIGIGRLPTFIAAEFIENGTLLPLLTDYRMAEKNIYAVFPEKELMPQKVRVFIDFLIDQLGGDNPPWDLWRDRWMEN